MWSEYQTSMNGWDNMTRAMRSGASRVVDAPGIATWDDDLVDSSAKMTEVNTKTIIPREGEGQTMDTATDLLTGTVVDSHVRKRGGDAFLSQISTLSQGCFKYLCFDRWYTKWPNLMALSAKAIPSGGTTTDSAAKSQAFTIVDYGKTKRLADMGERLLGQTPFTVPSYVGIGAGAVAAYHEGGNAVCAGVRCRALKELGDQPGQHALSEDACGLPQRGRGDRRRVQGGDAR